MNPDVIGGLVLIAAATAWTLVALCVAAARTPERKP